MAEQDWTDQRMQTAVGNLLRVGVLLAAAVTLFGGTLYLIHYGGTSPSYHMFHAEPEELSTFSGILMGVASFHRRAIIQFGLLLLILTPVARVAFSLFGFALQRDCTYVAVTLVVLLILLSGLVGVHL
jgi:uncharacterized membrane protein